jgi:hypothetical protein
MVVHSVTDIKPGDILSIGQPILAAKVPALTRINRDFVAEAISFETAVT